MDRLYHYTPGTGHGRWSPRSEVLDKTTEHIGGCLQAAIEASPDSLEDVESLPVIPVGAGFAFTWPLLSETGSWMFSVGLDWGGMMARCWVITTEEQANEVWPQVQHFSEEMGLLCTPKCPELPCLAAVLVLTPKASREHWEAVADLERCIAWTIIESEKQPG